METVRKILDFSRPGTAIEFSVGSEREIELDRLINILNFANFQAESIVVNFRHPKHPRTVSLDATPLPCVDHRLECRWTIPEQYRPGIASLVFDNLFIIDGQKLVTAVPELLEIGETGAVFRLPEKSIEVNCRKTRRQPSEGVEVELLQNGARFKGKLLDFTAASFNVETDAPPGLSFNWINADAPVHVVFSKHATTIYSGMCRITSQGLGPRKRGYLLEPIESNVRRFRPKKIRSLRREILPLPNALFTHPLSGKGVELKVIDISGSGCSVREEVELSTLFPGMIVPELEIRIADLFAVTCVAQVVHRSVQKLSDGSRHVKCGLAFLNMDIRRHTDLLSLLSLAGDGDASVGMRANTDELWRFFFESGLINPEKYALVQADGKRLKERYDKLYTQSPTVARQFVHRENGAVLGQMAMLRFYEKSWLIRHEAAGKAESPYAGLAVLNQLARTINDCCNLRSAQMDYALLYYRPEQEFADRICRAATRLVNHGKGCSIDTFACVRYRRDYSDDWNFSGPWALTRSTADDLRELEDFYEEESGGLMLHALDLGAEPADAELAREYEELGFTMKRHCYTLKKDGGTKALIAVNVSDVGLDLTDITNCFHLLVLDGEELPGEIAFPTLSILAHKYRQSDLPVLVYPADYAEAAGIECEKLSLCCMSIPDSGPTVMKYLNGLTTRSRSGTAVRSAAARPART